MEPLTEEIFKNLEQKARDIRISIIEMLTEAGSGHLAGPLGMSDIFALFYFHILRHDPKNPLWEERDRLVLSNGHICPVLYSAMAHAGYFPLEELKTLRKFGSRLQGHPHREFLPFVETSSGPLGEGLSQAVGMALAERIDNPVSEKYFYCFTGDGELDEGQIWEAALLAGKEKLKNLIVVVDRNNIQIDGPTDKVMPLDPLKMKWESFGWNAEEVDGNDIRALYQAVSQMKERKDGPNVIIAKTIPGKGIPEIEGKFEWHGKTPTKEETERFLEILQANKE